MKKFANIFYGLSAAMTLVIQSSTGSTAMVKLKPQIRFLCIYVRERRGCMICDSRPLYVLRLSLENITVTTKKSSGKSSSDPSSSSLTMDPASSSKSMALSGNDLSAM